MKHQVSLCLWLSAVALATGAEMTNSVLPSPQSLQARILRDYPGNHWSKTWTSLTVKKGGCPPWGCSFPPFYMRVIDDAEPQRMEAYKRLCETEIPRLPARPAFSDSFSVSFIAAPTNSATRTNWQF